MRMSQPLPYSFELSLYNQSQQIKSFFFFFEIHFPRRKSQLPFICSFLFKKCSLLVFEVIQNDMVGKVARLDFLYYKGRVGGGKPEKDGSPFNIAI